MHRKHGNPATFDSTTHWLLQYLLFESYPIIFGRGGHNFNAGIQGLMFLPLLGGGVAGGLGGAPGTGASGGSIFTAKEMMLYWSSLRHSPDVREKFRLWSGPVYVV